MLKNNFFRALILSILFFSQVISQNTTANFPEPANLDEAISNCLECSESISSNIETTTCLKL